MLYKSHISKKQFDKQLFVVQIHYDISAHMHNIHI